MNSVKQDSIKTAKKVDEFRDIIFNKDGKIEVFDRIEKQV